jgi:DMSO/TMAO reductase YedYZ heme-binding membrane subunit
MEVVMLRSRGARFWLETVVALLSGILGVLSVFWRDWIERVTGWDPDRHTGSVEWAIIAALLIVSVAMALRARSEWQRWTSARHAMAVGRARPGGGYRDGSS